MLLAVLCIIAQQAAWAAQPIQQPGSTITVSPLLVDPQLVEATKDYQTVMMSHQHSLSRGHLQRSLVFRGERDMSTVCVTSSQW